MRSRPRPLRLLALALCAGAPGCLGPELPQPEPDAGAELDAEAPVEVARPPDLAPTSLDAAAPDARSTTSTSTTAPRDGGTERPPAGPASTQPSPNALFGFENAAPDWTSSEAVLMRDSVRITEGTSSLMFVSKNFTRINSRAFDTSELSGITGRLSLDVYLTFPEGQVTLQFECSAARIGATNLGTRSLAGYPLEAWNTIYFEVPARIVSALATKYNGCKIWFEHHGNGVTRYDRLTFVP